MTCDRSVVFSGYFFDAQPSGVIKTGEYTCTESESLWSHRPTTGVGSLAFLILSDIRKWDMSMGPRYLGSKI